MILILFILLFIKSIQNDEETEGFNKKNIQTLTNKSVGYIPIEEIIRRVNLTQIHNTSRFFNEIDAKSTLIKSTTKNPFKNVTKNVSTKFSNSSLFPKEVVIKTLLTGTDDELLKIPYKIILTNLKLIDISLLSDPKKTIIWDLIVKDIPVEKMNRVFLEETNGLWYEIPEHELIKFNIVQDNLVDYLGTSKYLKRRQAAILAYMIRKSNREILQKIENINKVKGLICGFPELDLSNIPSDVFIGIEKEVFQNIWPCTLEQVNVLLNNAIRPDTYGPLEVWTKEIFEKLALIVRVIKPNEFRKLNSEVFQGLTTNILDIMTDEQLAQFTGDQTANLDDNVLMSYNLRISNFQQHKNTENNSNSIYRIKRISFLLYVSFVYFLIL